MAVAALRPDRAARPLRGGEFRDAAQALSQLPVGLRVPQREARPRPLPPVHAVRRRHRGLGLARRRRRDVHDGGRRHGGARHSARQLCGEGEQSQGAGRGAGGRSVSTARSNAGTRLTVLRAIDKLDRLGEDGVSACCSARGRKDEFGRFHQGCWTNTGRRTAEPTVLDASNTGALAVPTRTVAQIEYRDPCIGFAYLAPRTVPERAGSDRESVACRVGY